MKFFEDFKKFAFKGNVIDMAVGVIIGAAFGAIVTSLVNDIVSPFISLLTGNLNFADLKWVLREAVMDGETVAQAEVAVKYGAFLQAVIYFFLVALSIFIFVRIITKSREKLESRSRKAAEEAAAKAKAEEEAKAKAEAEALANAPKAPTTEELLIEIRDLLSKNVK